MKNDHMILGRRIIAAMDNVAAAHAWLKAEFFAQLAKRNDERARGLQERVADEAAETVLLKANIAADQMQIARLTARIAELEAEVECAANELEHWIGVATRIARDRLGGVYLIMATQAGLIAVAAFGILLGAVK